MVHRPSSQATQELLDHQAITQVRARLAVRRGSLLHGQVRDTAEHGPEPEATPEGGHASDPQCHGELLTGQKEGPGYSDEGCHHPDR